MKTRTVVLLYDAFFCVLCVVCVYVVFVVFVNTVENSVFFAQNQSDTQREKKKDFDINNHK